MFKIHTERLLHIPKDLIKSRVEVRIEMVICENQKEEKKITIFVYICRISSFYLF